MPTAHPPLASSELLSQPQLQEYDIQEVWCEGQHTITYRGIRSFDGLPVLLKTLREPSNPITTA